MNCKILKTCITQLGTEQNMSESWLNSISRWRKNFQTKLFKIWMLKVEKLLKINLKKQQTSTARLGTANYVWNFCWIPPVHKGWQLQQKSMNWKMLKKPTTTLGSEERCEVWSVSEGFSGQTSWPTDRTKSVSLPPLGGRHSKCTNVASFTHGFPSNCGLL